MQPDDLRAQLQRWGHATVNRFALPRSERSSHVLEKTRDMAPGTRERAERQLIGRDGRERRRFMAARSGVKKLYILPKWAVDPVRASNDARLVELPVIAVDQGIPDELRWLDSAIGQLQRQFPLRAMCLKEEFCGVGSQRVKAKSVEKQYGGRLSYWMYRRELDRALDFIQVRRAA